MLINIQQSLLTDAQAQPCAFHQMDSRGHAIHFEKTQSPVQVHVVIHNHMSDTGRQHTRCLSPILPDLLLEDLISSVSDPSRQDANRDLVKSVSWDKKDAVLR